MGLHDRHGDDGVAVSYHFPCVDLVKDYAVLDVHLAGGIGLILEVDDGDALISEILIAAFVDGQLRVGSCCGRLSNDRLSAYLFALFIKCKADFPTGDSAGQTVGRARYQIGLDDDFVARLDDIFDTAQILQDLIDRCLNGFVVISFGFPYRNC